MKSLRQSIPSLLVITLIVAGVAVVAGLSNTDLWYRRLIKPELNPPGWVFGPVWTILYIMIIVAAWMVWRTETYRRSKVIAMGAFGVQMVLNGLWSWLFFGEHEPGLALIDIGLLNVAIIGMILAYLRINRVAALMMIPYLLWVAFATYLNWAIWTLN